MEKKRRGRPYEGGRKSDFQVRIWTDLKTVANLSIICHELGISKKEAVECAISRYKNEVLNEN